MPMSGIRSFRVSHSASSPMGVIPDLSVRRKPDRVNFLKIGEMVDLRRRRMLKLSLLKTSDDRLRLRSPSTL